MYMRSRPGTCFTNMDRENENSQTLHIRRGRTERVREIRGFSLEKSRGGGGRGKPVRRALRRGSEADDRREPGAGASTVENRGAGDGFLSSAELRQRWNRWFSRGTGAH